MGRKTTYTDKAADEICSRIADGEPLRQICRDEHMPAWQTVYGWMEANADFAKRIARARELGYDAIAQECLDIADDKSSDTISTDNGDRANTEWIGRSKLRIETRLKLLAKWDPKRYGEKMDLQHSGPDGGPIQMSFTTKDADL